MHKIPIFILMSVFLLSCGDNKFNEDTTTGEKEVFEQDLKTSSFSFEASLAREEIKGKIVRKDNNLVNVIPLTIDNNLQNKSIKIKLKSNDFDYFKSIRKIEIIDENQRSNGAELDFIVDRESDLIEFSIYNFRELIRSNVIELKLKFEKQDQHLSLVFRNRINLSLEKLSDDEVVLIDKKFNSINILGAKHNPINYYSITNTEDEPITIDIATASKKGKISYQHKANKLTHGDCSHKIEEEISKKDDIYYIVPVNKRFAQAVSDIRVQDLEYNNLITISKDETLIVGFYVTESEFSRLSGLGKQGETVAIEASISCTRSCKYKDRYSSVGNLWQHRQVKPVLTGIVESSAFINLQDRMLLKYSEENIGAAPSSVLISGEVFNKQFSQPEKTVKRDHIHRMLEKKSFKHCSKGGRGTGAPDIR